MTWKVPDLKFAIPIAHLVISMAIDGFSIHDKSANVPAAEFPQEASLMIKFVMNEGISYLSISMRHD